MIASSAKYQALLTDTERKLAQAAAAADEARDTVRRRGGRGEGRWGSWGAVSWGAQLTYLGHAWHAKRPAA